MVCNNKLSDTIIIRGLYPKILKEKAIEYAYRGLLFRRRYTVASVELYYKPYLIVRYRASITRKNTPDIEDVTTYIVVDMLTGVGFEDTEFSEANISQIAVERCRVLESELTLGEVQRELEKAVFKVKSRIYRLRFKVIREESSVIGIVYKPIWVVELKDGGKARYIGVDAVKGVKIK